MSQGKIITIEGVDGCGKNTQTKELAKNLIIAGYGCHTIDFPRYHTETGKKIKAHQDNKTLKKLGLEEITRLYAQDRAEAQKEILFWLNYTHIINNRYIESNLAYQGARYFKMRRNIWGYILSVELKEYNIRPSDIVVLLDTPPEHCLEAMKKQGRRLDSNEEDLDYQRRVRECYLELAQINSDTWIFVDCLKEDGQKRKKVEDVSKEIFNKVKKILPEKDYDYFNS